MPDAITTELSLSGRPWFLFLFRGDRALRKKVALLRVTWHDTKKILMTSHNSLLSSRYVGCTVESHPDHCLQRISGAVFGIVALAASAGGLTVLSHVLAFLLEGFPATLSVAASYGEGAIAGVLIGT